jgi:dTDP-4-amino-4,6-dideoxygalactose transaminase
VASGTAALHLALEALGLPLASAVLVPEFTMIACARAVTMAGLRPVFVDCGPDLLLDTDLLDKAWKKARRTCNGVSAIMPVHVYGRRCDMPVISDFAKNAGLAVIEDLAEAHGIQPHVESEAACWSFYRNKIIHGEEGGMIAFQDKRAADRARALRCLGFTEEHDFLHVPRGVNARMSNCHADRVLTSLRSVNSNLVARWRVEQYYNARVPHDWWLPSRQVCWVYPVCLVGVDTVAVVKALNEQDIAARHGFKPMSMQPEYLGEFKQLRAYQASQEVIYLPVNQYFHEEEVNRIVGHLKVFVAQYRKGEINGGTGRTGAQV